MQPLHPVCLLTRTPVWSTRWLTCRRRCGFHTCSAVWVIHVSMALQYSLAVVYGTGGEVSVHRQRVGGFHTCGVKGKLCHGLRCCVAARSEWAHLHPWWFGWDCSQFPPNTWRKSYKLNFLRFCSVCVSRYDNKTNEAMTSWGVLPIGCRNEWTGSSSSQFSSHDNTFSLVKELSLDWTTNNKCTEVYMILMTSACILH